MYKRNICLEIAYDGTDFFGWQQTQEGRSVEGLLSEMVQRVVQEKVTLQAASRTDRGVHADQQVVNFFTTNTSFTTAKLHESLICLLPDDLCVISCKEMEAEFHPTLDCTHKEYHYRLCYGRWQAPKQRLYSWHRPCIIDLKAMRHAATQLIGTHDFTAFCNSHPDHNPANHTRKLSQITIDELTNHSLHFTICGNAFLYRMVRNLVGTLLWIGRGRLSTASVVSALEKRERSLVGVTAPAHGLTLHRVRYPAPNYSVT